MLEEYAVDESMGKRCDILRCILLMNSIFEDLIGHTLNNRDLSGKGGR